jgi:periplasmic divalent cation tolerance protein
VSQISRHTIVITTCQNHDEAEALAKVVLNARLAACVHWNEIQSMYWWNGKMIKSPEVRLMLKTRQNLVEKLMTAVKLNHSYKVPQVIAIPIIAGSKDYLDWVDSETQGN